MVIKGKYKMQKKGVFCGTLKEYFIGNISIHFELNIIATLLLTIMFTGNVYSSPKHAALLALHRGRRKEVWVDSGWT